jgi:hypothetical protein
VTLRKDPSEARHGTVGEYTNWGCRCDPCRDVYNSYERARRHARASRPVPADVEHGTYATYINYGCRCDRCRAANAEASRRRYASRRVTS